ncbi:MAG: response regulator [Thermoleophilaceae bacterium]
MSGVLVVDDDPFIRKLIVTTLEDVAKQTPVEAGDGEEAVLMNQRETPEIVFLDLNMPRMGASRPAGRCGRKASRSPPSWCSPPSPATRTNVPPRTRARISS